MTFFGFFLAGLSFSDWDSDFFGLLDPSVGFLGTGSFFAGPDLGLEAPPPPVIMVEKRSEDFANFFGGGFFP